MIATTHKNLAGRASQDGMIPAVRKMPSRREFFVSAALAGATVFCSLQDLISPGGEQPQGVRSVSGGKFLGVVPFTGESRIPMGQAFGAELDGRLYTDLTGFSVENPVTPVEEFYVRTRASSLLDATRPWSIRVGGELQKPFELSMEEVKKMIKPMGRHLLECAGNARSAHFGMMSVADWSGVEISEIQDRARLKPSASRVLVSGFDTYAAKSASSVPGASWIFTIDDLHAAGAFLATEMNGTPLTKDHGAPVRLVVPGWYGCACIKWANEITFTSDNEPATLQMQEYATRTMQKGVPKLARDYQRAVIEQAAMPIRIEKWAVDSKLIYRVVGILWGGSVPIRRLQIRFNPDEEYVDVPEFVQERNDPWSFWSCVWQPKQPGTYLIRLAIAEPRVATRRLDAGYYMRSVDIAEV